jgi:hypothetical protein
MRLLRPLACDEMLGFFFSRPIPGEVSNPSTLWLESGARYPPTIATGVLLQAPDRGIGATGSV